MRNHGWQPPFHPLQTVAIAVFCTLAFSFYVFFAPFLGTRTLKFVIIGCFTPLVGAVCILYIACTWIDPADPGVHRSHEHYSTKKEAETGPNREDRVEGEEKKSLQSHLAIREEGLEPTGCKPCQTQQQEPADLYPDEDILFCSICNANISTHSKHCRACDKCVHGFDHHCRWLNNCVGTRNYKPFVALMVTCLLMLILEWVVGIVVLVRCFSNQSSFDQEINDKLGRSFPRAAFITVLFILTLLAVVATAPLTQLFCFHLILMHKGITTYDYILAVREEKLEFWEENGGSSSLTTSPATSTETGFSGYNSAACKRIVFCTPPRMFVDQDQTVMALSDLEVGAGKAGAGKIIDSARSKRRPGVPGLNPWKLARVTTEEATRAAARARAKSSILLPNRPDGTASLAPAALTLDTDSSSTLHSSSAGEIRLASRTGRLRKPPRPLLPRPTWPSHAKHYRVSPDDSELSLTSSVDSGLPALPLEPRSPYRDSPRSPNDAYTGDPRASFPVPQGPYPAHFLFPRFPGDPGLGQGQAVGGLDSSVDGAVRRSVNSDGYEASCGESGDETSETVGLSPAWNQPSWGKGEEALKGEDGVKPWVATFPGGGSAVPEAVGSPAGQSVSSGSRVEANILKANPELRHARMQSSSPTVYEESPLRESSDFMSEDTTTSNGEPPDRSTMTSFFYTGPESVSFRATWERQGVSNIMPMNRLALSRADPKLLVDTL